MNDDDKDNPIDRSLGIGPLAPIDYSQTISTIIGQAANDSAKEDFTFSRSNIREVVENGTEAITKLALIAEQSQNPRAFEVLAKLMDTVVNASDKLITLQKTMTDIEKVHEPHSDEAKKHVTNQLFVGSTAELAALIANNKPALPS